MDERMDSGQMDRGLQLDSLMDVYRQACLVRALRG